MMRNLRCLALVLMISFPSAAALAAPCVLVDNGSGTVDLPPDGCGYLSPADVHELIDASELPLGTTIEFAVDHKDFVCSNGGAAGTGYGGSCSVTVDPVTCEGPGPSAGTVTECFESVAEITLTGTGALLGYSESLTIPLFTEVVADRGPGDPNPSFDTEMVALSGELPPGSSSNFCFLAIQGGSDLSGPSTGHVELTPIAGGKFQVDSFFDVSYSITYQGCPGGALDGLSGVSDTQNVHVEAESNSAGLPSSSPISTFLLILALLGGAGLAARRA